MEGLIGKKVGMTQIFDENGKRICVTVIEVGPCPVVQLKTPETDGYTAAQIGFGVQKEQRLTKPVVAHQKKAGLTEFVRVLKEFKMVTAGPFRVQGPLQLHRLDAQEADSDTGLGRDLPLICNVAGPNSHQCLQHCKRQTPT